VKFTPILRRAGVVCVLISFVRCLPLAHAADIPAVMPVPPEVAIARPSAADVAVLEASLKKFVTQADAATKAVIAKYPDVLAVRPPRATNPAVVPFLANGFRAKHAANVERAKQGDGREGVVNPPSAGKAIFDKYYGGMKVANFGISGDTTQGVLYRLRDGEGQGFQPKAIMLMIGTNNAGPCSSAEIAEGVGAIVLEMRKDFPQAKILLLAIFPATPCARPWRT
jgi:hypothetical protein